MTIADVLKFLTTDIFLVFFFLPFVVVVVVMLAQMAIRSKAYAGEIPWNDTQREAYIAGAIAAVVTVVVTVIIGGPEVFVLYWRPLITTVIVLPLGFAAALILFGVWRKVRG
ncbi:MAG: hypothetical protein GKS02_00960 [Alphaproteobacteria bacterium]|nr:hypothetical protein [Alphaproteobacteria bacterium]